MNDPNRSKAWVEGRYGSDQRRRDMVEYLAFRHNIGRQAGDVAPRSLQKAEETLDRLGMADLTMLELEMQSRTPQHESDYDPFARSWGTWSSRG